MCSSDLTPDSTTSSLVKYSFAAHNSNNELKYTINTSLRGFQLYRQKGSASNLLFSGNSTFYKGLGNLGTAHQELVYMPDLSNMNIRFGINSLNKYIIDPENVKYYDVKSSFTELFFVIGSKNEQLFKVTHTQNLKKNFNVGIEYQKLTSEGFYIHQKTNNWNFVFFSRYRTKNNRYKLLTSIDWNNLKIEENGGISDDSLFENETGINKKTVAVNLLSAENSLKGGGLYLKQYLGYGRNKNTEKTVTNSSNMDDTHLSGNNLNKPESDSIKPAFGFPKHFISHVFHYNRKALVYKDDSPNVDFYPSAPEDTLETLDTIFISRVENTISMVNTFGKKKEFSSDLSISHQSVLIIQNKNDTLYNNYSLRTKLFNSDKYDLHWNIAGEYVIFGRNIDDFLINASLQKELKGRKETDKKDFHGSNKTFAGKAVVGKRSPSIVQNQYYSNNFVWEYDFKKTDILYGKLEYIMNKEKFKFGVSFSKLKNYIYFDSLARPKQFTESLYVLAASLIKNFKLGKWHIDNNIVYQYLPKTGSYSSEAMVIRIPEIILKHSLYYEGFFFKNALFTQIGTDIFYNSAYYADSYMPATRQFYLQNDNKIGNYIYIDLFVNFKIQKARIFFKAEHINSGFMGNYYYMVPHYPMADISIKLGISWMFYD